MLQIAFCRSRKVGSRLIRLFCWSRWSHVALVRDGWVIEAVYPYVRLVPLSVFKSHHDDVRLVPVTVRNDFGVWEAALKEVGKPYDWTALLGILLRRNWQKQDRWFCSELVSWCFAQAHAPLWRDEYLPRVTPQHLWMLSRIG